QVHRRKSGKHDQANCGHLISPAAGHTPAFRMSQNAAYMTVSSSMTSLFGGRITSQKLLGTTDDINKNKALFTKVDKKNETLCVSLRYGRGFELRSWSI